MSALLNANPKSGGAVPYLDGALAPSHFQNGLPFDAGQVLAVDIDGIIDHYHQGLGYTSTGRLAITLTGAPARFGNGAAPLNATGHLVFVVGANTHHQNGIGYTSNSSVGGTLAPP